jgi:hypothetical protein
MTALHVLGVGVLALWTVTVWSAFRWNDPQATGQLSIAALAWTLCLCIVAVAS